MKAKSMLAFGVVAGIGGILLFGRRAKAATSSLVIVDGKFGAVAVGAQIVAGGRWVIVASDKTHWKELRGVLEARALAKTGTTWVLADMDMLRKEAEGRGVVIPTSAWGGVAYVDGGDLESYSYFYGSIVEAVVQIGEPGGVDAYGADVDFLAAFGLQ